MKNYSQILLSGADAEKFLQGQLTCDVTILSATTGCPGAYCDHKGRMLCNFWIFRLEKEGFLIWLPQDMLTITVETLKKYGAFSKVTITADPSWYSTCLTTDIANPTSALVAELPGNRQLHLSQKHLSLDNILDETAFNLTNVKANCVFLRPATSLQFTPQMIAWEKIGGVSFTKGCYLGQEVVARTEHLGKLKRHLHQASIDQSATVNIGDPVINDANQTVGTICSIACNDMQHLVLAVIQDHALENTLFTGPDNNAALQVLH